MVWSSDMRLSKPMITELTDANMRHRVSVNKATLRFSATVMKYRTPIRDTRSEQICLFVVRWADVWCTGCVQVDYICLRTNGQIPCLPERVWPFHGSLAAADWLCYVLWDVSCAIVPVSLSLVDGGFVCGLMPAHVDRVPMAATHACAWSHSACSNNTNMTFTSIQVVQQ